VNTTGRRFVGPTTKAWRTPHRPFSPPHRDSQRSSRGHIWRIWLNLFSSRGVESTSTLGDSCVRISDEAFPSSEVAPGKVQILGSCEINKGATTSYSKAAMLLFDSCDAPERRYWSHSTRTVYQFSTCRQGPFLWGYDLHFDKSQSMTRISSAFVVSE
jgi:hypothetical protein